MKQSSIADSTMEVEYITASKSSKEVEYIAASEVGLRNFLMHLGVMPSVQSAIAVYCDNSKAVANSKEPSGHKRGKHIERKYHLIWEIVNSGDVKMRQIASKDNLAYPFTKGLTHKTFDRHV